MNLFRKKDKKSDPIAPQVEANEVDNGTTGDSVQAESPVQEPVMSRVEIERKIREEAKRLRVTEHLLSAPHLQRVNDALRLNETKLTNVEENLARTREQKDRLRRYKELQGELEQQRAHLFEVNKQAAGMLNEKGELERFETFENVQGRFQRLQILERQRRSEKVRESALAGDMERLSRELEDETKRLRQCLDEANNSEKQLMQGQTAVCNATRLEGANDAMAYVKQKLGEGVSLLTHKGNALEKEQQEQQAALDQLSAEVEKKRAKLQGTDVHRRMVKHCELVVDQLTRLSGLAEKIAQTEVQLKDAERRQRAENDLLGRVFADYQQVEAQINTASDELAVHRQSIHGMDSYRLQERAMNLKQRRQMLQGAQALWNRISALYVHIEDKTQQINTLRLHEEHTLENVRKMEAEVGILRRSYKEKEYTYTLSKSQNVIQLRGDLKEGVNCTVCGATHHPYHSDTMLEQNKLIGEMKTEAELLRAELNNREQELLEARLDLAQTSATKKACENELITMRSLQNESVKDWAMFASLDSSFHSCDSTTNAEARTIMLRQLIENSETEVRKAQEELDNYNFHQGRINVLTETMARLEQERNELTVRMNEINTGCQVLAREVDWISANRQSLNASYAQLFEVLDKRVSIPEWQAVLKRGPEGITMRIQEIAAERKMLTEELDKDEQQLEMMNAMLERNRQLLAEVRQHSEEAQSAIADLSNLTEENVKELERLLQGMNSKQYYEMLVKQYMDDCRKMEDQRSVTDAKNLDYLTVKGRWGELRETSSVTDSMTAQERSALDVWMRQYNASHSPVQYSELEQFFEVERDWTAIRQKIRQTDMDARLTQAKVDQLRSQLVALQAEGNIHDGDTTEALLSLAKQEEILEKRRMDVMLLVATNTLTLQAHEKAESQLKDEKMREKTK